MNFKGLYLSSQKEKKEIVVLAWETTKALNGSENVPQKVNSRSNKLLLFQPFFMIHRQMLTTFSGDEF